MTLQTARAMSDLRRQQESSLRSHSTTEDFFRVLSSILQTQVGFEHFTVLLYDKHTGTLLRLHSTNTIVDPIGHRKAVTDSFWVRHVLQEGKILCVGTREEVQTLFCGNAVEKLGYESVLNIPIHAQKAVIGTLNLLGGPDKYNGVSLDDMQKYAALAEPVISKIMTNTIPAEPFDKTSLESV